MQDINKILSARSLCAFLSAAAVIKLDPKALIISHAATPWGFYCDCVLSSDLDASFLPRLEEVVADYIRSKIKISSMEMEPNNAAEMLKHQGQHYRAEALRNSDRATVSILKIEHFSDQCNATLAELPRFFSFIGTQKLATPHTFRIFGTAYCDAGELRKAKKDFKNLPPTSYQEWLELLELTAPLDDENSAGWIWLPRGVALLDALYLWWKERQQSKGSYLVATSKIFNDTLNGVALRHGKLLFSGKYKNIVEWVHTSSEQSNEEMIDPPGHRMACSSVLGSPEELLPFCISSLQNLLEIPKIFHFSFHRLVLRSGRLKNKASPIWKACAATLKQAVTDCNLLVDTEEGGEFSGPSIEVRFLDIWGTEHCCSLAGFEYKLPYSKGNEVLWMESAVANVERLIAQSLEVKKGELPFLIVPEQAQIICVSSNAEDYAQKVLQVLLDKRVRAAYSVCEQRALAAQVHRAMSLKIPYIIVVGEKERLTETIALRESSSEEGSQGAMRVMKLNELLEQLQQEEKA